MTSGRMLGPALGALLALSVAPPARAGESARARTTDAYVLSRGDHFSIASSTMEELKAARRRYPGDFLWARRAGREYLSQDANLLAEAIACFDTLEETASPRREVEERREELESEQRALEAEQESLDRDADAAADAEAEEADSESAAVSEDADRERETRRRDLESRARDLEARDREIDGAEQRIDRRDDELERAAEARLWRLIDRAIADGSAQPVSAADR
jgi:hypothetical protein